MTWIRKHVQRYKKYLIYANNYKKTRQTEFPPAVRTRSIPFTINVEENQTRKRLLEALYAPHPETSELTLDEINEEIRAARRERKEY